MRLSRRRLEAEVTVVWCGSRHFPQRQVGLPPTYPSDLPFTVEKNSELGGNV